MAHQRLIEPGVLLVVTARVDGQLTPQPGRAADRGWRPVAIDDVALPESRGPRSRRSGAVAQHRHHPRWNRRRGEAARSRPGRRGPRCSDPLLRCGRRARMETRRAVVPSLPNRDRGCDGIRYAQSGDQHVARWPSRQEFLRRATSATRVGEPEPVLDLFGGRQPPNHARPVRSRIAQRQRHRVLAVASADASFRGRLCRAWTPQTDARWRTPSSAALTHETSGPNACPCRVSGGLGRGAQPPAGGSLGHSRLRDGCCVRVVLRRSESVALETRTRASAGGVAGGQDMRGTHGWSGYMVATVV
jgi:hypothetical protein